MPRRVHPEGVLQRAPRRLGLRVAILLFATFVLGTCWLARGAHADESGASCGNLTIDGRDAAGATSPGTAIEVDANGTARIVAATQFPAILNVTLAYGPVRWQVISNEPVVGGGNEFDLNIGDYARYGVGVYLAEATLRTLDGRLVCSQSGWIRLGGRSPVTTVAGVAIAAILVGGLALLVFGLIRGGVVRGVIGGAMVGLGTLVAMQQSGRIGVTSDNAVIWTVVPGALGGISARLRARFAKSGTPRPPPPPTFVRPPARRIVGRVVPSGGGGAITTALQPNTAHEFHVRIGFAAALEVAASTPLDETTIPRDDQPHPLQIVYQELAAVGPIRSGTVLLPPAGDSDQLSFLFTTGDGGTYQARIIVSYRNRVLQTARFEADILGEAQPPTGRPPIRLSVETNARPSMFEPSGHAGFDMAFVVNHDQEGRGRALVVHDGEPSAFDTGPFDETLAWFEDSLSKLAEAPGDYTSLDSSGTVKLLRDMAIRGHDLFTHLLDWQVSDEILHPKLGRIQLVPGRPDSFFPLEFVYDKALPRDGATLCPNAREALEQGACPESCPPDGDQGSVVCPLGFWCMSRVIERQPFLRARHIPTDEAQLLAEPVEGRDSLQLFAGVVYGASDRVDGVQAGSIKRVSDALTKAVGTNVTPVDRWADWRTTVASSSPSTLVALCHTEAKREAGESVLQFEIGSATGKDWLGVNQIDPPDVLGPSGQPPPLVLLIGCSTGVPKVEFQSSVAAFMRSGASIVVSTLSTVLGEYAAQITAALVDELARVASTGDAAFGDALLRVRRSLLAAGMPMVMSITAFGDAEWRLTPRSA